MKILITGANGFVGRNLTENLKNIRDGKNRTRPGISIEEMPIQIIVALGITAMTFIITGNKYVNKGYNTLMEKISSYLIKAK